MNNWISMFLKTGRRQPLLNLFGRRRKNKGIIWGSLINIGVIAAAYGMRKGRNRNTFQRLQNFDEQFSNRNFTKAKCGWITRVFLRN